MMQHDECPVIILPPLATVSLPLLSYLIVSPTAGRQQQQSQSWEPENRHASHTSRSAGHRHESASTQRKHSVWTPQQRQLKERAHFSITLCCRHLQLNSPWILCVDLCSRGFTPGFYIRSTASVSPNMDYLGTKKAQNQLNSQAYQSHMVWTRV